MEHDKEDDDDDKDDDDDDDDVAIDEAVDSGDADECSDGNYDSREDISSILKILLMQFTQGQFTVTTIMSMLVAMV